MKKRKAPAASHPAGTVITNSSFQNVATAANEHTRDAAVALAKAAEANANATAKIAECLVGATFDGPMINIEGNRP